jgi:hypothetical protein
MQKGVPWTLLVVVGSVGKTMALQVLVNEVPVEVHLVSQCC